MKVSVLMPVYKTDARYLREAIQSVLNQTLRDFELLIADDCPEDDRADVVGEFADPRIVYWKNARNLGISETRNSLIARAQGEYLAILDHDDVCRQDRFEKEAAYLEAHPECGVVSSQVRRIPCGTVTCHPLEDAEIRLAMVDRCVVWHPAAMVRKTVLDRSGVRYEAAYSPTEDYMLWMRLLPLTRFANLPEPLTAYRWHETNTSVLRRPELDAAERRCRAWAKVHLPELCAEAGLRRTTVTRVRFFGVTLVKVESGEKETVVRLFGCLPLVKVLRRFG